MAFATSPLHSFPIAPIILYTLRYSLRARANYRFSTSSKIQKLASSQIRGKEMRATQIHSAQSQRDAVTAPMENQTISDMATTLS